MVKIANMDDKMRSAKVAYDKIVAHAQNEKAHGYIIILPRVMEDGRTGYELVYPLSHKGMLELLIGVAQQEMEDYVQQHQQTDLTSSH